MGKLFVKGQSGNPSGRAKGAERVARELADQLAGGEPFAGLRAVMQLAFERMTNETVEDRDRQGWAKIFVERAYGKPRESIDLSSEPALTEEEYAAEVVEIVRESIGAMTTEERMKLLVDHVATETVQ